MTFCQLAKIVSSEDEVAALRARVAELEAALECAAAREEQQRAAIVALRAAENAFTTVFEHAPFGIVIGSLDDSMLRANEAFEQITGYTAEEVAALTVPAITHPDDNARELPLIEDLFAGRCEHYQLEKRYIHKDGHLVPVLLTGLVVRNAEGAPQACVALVEDIGARLRAEEMRGYLAAILEATPDLVGYMTLDGKVEYLNRAWRRARNLPDDAELATLAPQQWQPDWAVEMSLSTGIPAAIRQGHWQGETALLDAAGSEIPVRQTILALRDSHDELARLATMLHDLREERRAAQERITLERKLQEAQRLESLGVLAAGIAHDFNNILTSILGNADLALLSPSLDQSAHESLEAVVAGAQRAAELTRQMLAYAGKGQLLTRPTDLNRLIKAYEETLRGAAGPRTRLAIVLSDPLPPVDADPAQLRQALLNLVANAGEAIETARPAGQITLRTAVEQLDRAALGALLNGAELPAGPYVRLTVEDNGWGMDRATLARIFEPFFSTKFLGRGLGLAAVQGIVRVHLGAMQVESTPGVGTQCSVWLPARV